MSHLSVPPVEQSQLTAVPVKLPPFWDRNPPVWFAQAETQIHLSGVTSQLTRFYHVISALSPTAADPVYDHMTTPPPENPHDQLKSALLKRTSSSDRDRLHQLLFAEELGERRPTQLLRRMKQLLGSDAPGSSGDVSSTSDIFLRQLFLQRLPRHVQMVLATAANLSLDELPALADAVMEVASASPQVDLIQRPALLPSPSDILRQSLALRLDEHGTTQQLNHLTSLPLLPVPAPQALAPNVTVAPDLVLAPLPLPLAITQQQYRRGFVVPSPLRRRRLPLSSAMYLDRVLGKLPGPPLVAAGGHGFENSRLSCIVDRISGMRFLIDTGAEVSVIPAPRSYRGSREHCFTLKAANASTIPVYGQQSLTLNIGLLRDFRWLFL
ncbi:uncharacterized protein LOC135395908 [Ornithodoros turicata]|uniref:uncharacterized protein LOC135395908 n=1 Tax=Ornithodoros turicata TaxID=34597 RepID=UPI003138E906